MDEDPVDHEDDVHVGELVGGDAEVVCDGGVVVVDGEEARVEAEEQEGFGVSETDALPDPRAVMILG